MKRVCLLNPDHLERYDMERLANLAFYLEGIKAGTGELKPLGTATIDSLWKAIHTLNGVLHDEEHKSQG